MLFGERCYRSVKNGITTLLLAIMWGELLLTAVGPALPNFLAFLQTQEAIAVVNTIDPDGNGTVQGSPDGVCGSNNFTCVDDGARSPSSPALPTTDYVQFNRNQSDTYTMGTRPFVNTVSSITVFYWHYEGATNYTQEIRLFAADEVTQYGTTQTLANQPSAAGAWGSVTFSGLSLTQSQLDGLRIRNTCIRTGGGNSFCRNMSMYAQVTYTETNNATVSANGTQQNVTKDTNQYFGGSFAITGTSGSANVTSITVNETGSIDASNNLKNITLKYDVDSVAPYDCASESYAVSDSQYGLVDSDGFSGANGSSVFTGSVGISTTSALCVYVVADVQAGATAGDTIELQITNPSTDVVGSGSLVVTPGTAVAIPGTSTVSESNLTQTGYHWRNDDGSETAASSATGGSQNTVYNNFPKATTKRLRLQVSNEGTATSNATNYRLEYASKSGFSTCGDVNTGWTDVSVAGGDFDMSNSANLTDGNNTTDVSTGGVSNPGGKSFLGTNAAVKDTSSQTAAITLTSSQFVEFEYSIISSGSVADGSVYCFRLTAAGTPLPAYTQYPELNIAADIQVSASGSHTANANIPTASVYAGGVFIVEDTGGAANTITGVTITETGTVNAASGLAFVELRYDLDTTAPYTCDDQSYSGADSQFGSATSFNGSNQASFSGSLTASTTQTICFYVEYDVTASSSNAETVSVEISNPSTDISTGGGSVAPVSVVAPTGNTVLQKSAIELSDYHWRNNDGNETGATSATGGVENTPFSQLAKNTTYRLRFAIGNTGSASASETQYQIEWAQKTAECSALESWVALDAGSDEWAMSPTGNVTQGGDTSDIAEGIGGVGTPAGFFLTDNNGFADDVDSTGSTTLPANNYFDAEFSIIATTLAVQGATYCFRVTANGTPLDLYTTYAEATIKLDTDFKIQRGFVTMTGSTATITAGFEYDQPASATTTFIRITNTQHTGAGPNTGNGNSNADDVTVYILNPGNITNNIVFSRGGATAGNTRVAYEIVEYTGVLGGRNEIYVRDASTLTFGSGNTVENGATVSGVVDNNDVVVFLTGHHNPDAGRNSYNLSLVTTDWNGGLSQPVFTREASGNASIASYAVVEFIGNNWRTQRVEHTYTLGSAGATTTSSMTAVNSLNRAFIHAQKRTSQNNHADYGHEVWLSGLGQISFILDTDAANETNHTSVVWVLENLQTQGVTMQVTRSNGSLSNAGTGPEANNINIGKTLSDTSIASIFTNNRSDEASRTWPEPILSVRLISSTQYELWRSDGGSNINFRTEVVEWPTAARQLTQNYYRIYENNDLLKPADAWPVGVGTSTLGENEPMTANDNPMAPGDVARIRMTLSVSASTMPAGLDSFKLQYASTTGACGAATNWQDLGDPGSGSVWRGFDTPEVDGTVLSTDPPAINDLLISIASIAGNFKESNAATLNPYTAFPGDELEYDWVVQHNGAEDKTSYCFRMTEGDGTLLNGYNEYPVLRTVGFDPRIGNWRWFDDETSPNPSVPLAAENIAPSNVANQNAIKLRLILEESSGAEGVDTKFALQYSEYADFSQSVFTLTATTSCVEDSLWCYYDGAGTDNNRITSSVVSGSSGCTTGSENGCGTINESISTTTATFDHLALINAEYEFTLLHAGARVNSVYYFRLYDVVNDEVVPLASGSSYPSLVTEGAAMNLVTTGLTPGTVVAGQTLDATTTPTAVPFGEVPFGTTYEAAQRFSIDTNATDGYQMLMFAGGQLQNVYGEQIQPLAATNTNPLPWSTACAVAAVSCFGYHTTDASLSGQTDRFAAEDSYSALETEPKEIYYSSIPIVDSFDLLYRILVTEAQSAGEYETNLVFIAVPVH